MQNAMTFTLGTHKLHLVFLTTVGSTLHKLNLSNSDLDLKGVFVWDFSATAGLETLPDSLDVKRTNSEDWANLMLQLNKTFNLELSPVDDVELFEAKKFFLTALKNDFNMFDMLFSPMKHLFVADCFLEILYNKDAFLNMQQATKRFGGMAKSSLHEARKLFNRKDKTLKEQNDLKKLMAKSLQFLFSLNNLLLTQTYSPVLPKLQRLEVLKVKKGEVSFDNVVERHKELSKALEQTMLNKNLLLKRDNRELLDKVLKNLNLSFL